MTENIYQKKLDSQYTYLSRGKREGHNPIFGRVYDLEEYLRETPLWAQSIREKQLSPVEVKMFQLETDSQVILDDIESLHEGEPMSTRFDSVRIEREVILDYKRSEVLIERLYYVWKDGFSELAWLSILANENSTGYKSNLGMSCTSECVHSGGKMGTVLKVSSARELLYKPIPLLLLSPDDD